MKRLLTPLLALLLALPAAAARLIERDMNCPLCGGEFVAKLDEPDPDYEQRLDLKPLGAIEGPWRLPVCPKCGFVVYSVQLPKPELARCRAAIAAPAYLAAAQRSSYYKAAVLYALLNKPDYLLANTWLKASWQEEASPAQLKEDQELALKHFTACAAACKGVGQENSRLLIGELLRRLGRFAEARAHYEALKGDKAFQNNFFADMADFELKLCAKQDASADYTFTEVKVAKLPPLERLRWHAKRTLFKAWAAVKRAAGR